MELHENLPVVDVEVTDDSIKFIFIDEKSNEVHEVVFHKKAYDSNKKSYIDSPDKLRQTEKWCEEYFGLPIDKIEDAVGQKHDVYAYDGFNALWEADKKFPKEMEGQIIQAKIKEIQLNDNGIKIRYTYDGNTYSSNMGFTQKVGDNFYVNPQKRLKQFHRFNDKFHVPIEDKDKLIGKKIMVEIKKAMGKYIYGDIKALPTK